MPPVLDPNNLYAADGPGRLSRVVRGFRPLVYVPNSKSSSVDVIDPETFRVVRHFAVGRQPQHVTPSSAAAPTALMTKKLPATPRRPTV